MSGGGKGPERGRGRNYRVDNLTIRTYKSNIVLIASFKNRAHGGHR